MKNSLTLYKVEYCQLRNTEFSQEDTVSVDSDKEICQKIQPHWPNCWSNRLIPYYLFGQTTIRSRFGRNTKM